MSNDFSRKCIALTHIKSETCSSLLLSQIFLLNHLSNSTKRHTKTLSFIMLHGAPMRPRRSNGSGGNGGAWHDPITVATGEYGVRSSRHYRSSSPSKNRYKKWISKFAHVSNVFTNEKKRLPRWILATMMIAIILSTTRRSSQKSSSSTIKEDSSIVEKENTLKGCLLYTSPSPRDATLSRMPSSA